MPSSHHRPGRRRSSRRHASRHTSGAKIYKIVTVAAIGVMAALAIYLWASRYMAPRERRAAGVGEPGWAATDPADSPRAVPQAGDASAPVGEPTAGGASDGPDDPVPGQADAPTVKEPSTVTFVLRDGTVVTDCRLLMSAIPIDTDYGRLSVPAEEIYLVLHEKRVQGPAGAAADATSPPGATVVRTPDTIVAKGFTMAGRLAIDAYEVDTPLGKHQLQAGKVARVIRGALGVETIMVPISLATSDGEEIKKWRVSLEPPAGWTAGTFDDSDWDTPAAVTRPGATITLSAQTVGMTYPDGISSDGLGFRRRFVLDAPPASAIVEVSWPGPFEIFVNGVSVGTRSGAHDVTKLLAVGINVIAVRIDTPSAEDLMDEIDLGAESDEPLSLESSDESVQVTVTMR